MQRYAKNFDFNRKTTLFTPLFYDHDIFFNLFLHKSLKIPNFDT